MLLSRQQARKNCNQVKLILMSVQNVQYEGNCLMAFVYFGKCVLLQLEIIF